MENTPKTDFELNLEPATIVIFGITGDLSQRRLLPALYHLLRTNLLHEKTRILGVTRRQDLKPHHLLDKAKLCVLEEDGVCSEEIFEKLKSKLEVYSMDASKPDDYSKLKKYLDDIERETGLCLSRVFYLAVPPAVSAPIIHHLGENKLNHGCQKHDAKARLLLEKPFGFDTKTAKALVEETTEFFDESQIFRIDHYLAKETVQNIVTFRFRNPIFEDIWDKDHVQSIAIEADESLGIEGRADFYEQTGALRDLIQSHLLHVMSVVMMDKPQTLESADDMHQTRLKLLKSIEIVPAKKLGSRVLRGQYRSYKEETHNDETHVETFAALKLFSKSKRWRGVPIFIKTGKALAKKQTIITIHFKPPKNDHDHTNRLIFSIQPNEGITIDLWVKKPGFEKKLETAEMKFSYKQTFDEEGHPDAYERVLVDAIRGDNMLFATSDEVMVAWRIIEPVIRAWAENGDGLKIYDSGSEGPDMSVLRGE
ncbi:MAG TPA: glucose-6-phosphate dehydrogenase [Candidatus Paceibacterota bacterium]|nr:glucose-6-phosphate dehydrogenase [Candidatus Paceibacterota bacterium]